jgi:hypothetical protein
MAAKDGILQWIADEKPRSKTGDGINLDMKIITSGDGLQIDVNSSVLTGKAFKIYNDNGSADLFSVDKDGNTVLAGKVTANAATITNDVGTATLTATGKATASSATFTNDIEIGGVSNVEITGTTTTSAGTAGSSTEAPVNNAVSGAYLLPKAFLLGKVSGAVVKIPYFAV